MKSLRLRLTVWLLIGMGLLLAAGGLVLDRVISSQLRRNHDAALIAKARSLASLTEEEGGKVWVELSNEVMPEFERRENPDYFELRLRDGAVVERSRSLGARDLPRSGGPLDRPVLSDLTLPDGRRGRQVEISFHPRSEELEVEEEKAGRQGSGSDIAGNAPQATLAVAHSREDLDALLVSVRVTLALVVLALLAGTALLVRAVVGAALVPLDSLAHRLERMDAGSLGQKLPAVADTPAELVPVVYHLNGLLARLDDSFARERSFSANLAHELRTPLAELRTLTEVSLKWPGEASSELEVLREVQGIGLQMERVVENLLALARYDGRQHTVCRSEVPLRAMAASCWQAVAADATDKEMTLRLEIPEGLTVVTDRDKLALILSNLFSNAVAYGRQAGAVTCAATAAGAELVLRVGNATDLLAAEDLPRIFHRFWRKDPARSGGRHVGLGLALVAALCDLLGFATAVRLADGWFEITLRGSLEH